MHKTYDVLDLPAILRRARDAEDWDAVLQVVEDDVPVLVRKVDELAVFIDALDDHVDMTPFLDDDGKADWSHQYRWCAYCWWKEPDGHAQDCEMERLKAALASVEKLED